MNSGVRNLLRRLRANLPTGDPQSARHRSRLRFHASLYRVLLKTGNRADSFTAVGQAAIAELAAIPDTPELQQADADCLARHHPMPPGEAERVRALLLVRLDALAAERERQRNSESSRHADPNHGEGDATDPRSPAVFPLY